MNRQPVAAPLAIRCNGASLHADPSGALFWPAEATLVVADLHFEKGSSFARHGRMVPPYDTRATLGRLADAARRHAPRRIVCLGDTFHDGTASERLAATDARFLAALVAAHDWYWVAGNHDPVPPTALGGRVVGELTIGPLVFRHAARENAAGEISGHYHPMVTVLLRQGRMTTRCFLADRRRLVLPAFGAFAGGLDAFDPAIAALFPDGFRVHVLGRDRVMTMPLARLAPSPYHGMHNQL